MSSPYQVLDNRPIDQWKVTELKEELKKRRLTIRGLKEDLVKRLDEAVRIEREAAEEEDESAEEEDESSQEEPESARKEDEGAQKEAESAPPAVEKAPETEIPEDFRGIAQNDDKKTEEENNLSFSEDTKQENIQEGYVLVEKTETTLVEETTVHETVGDGTSVTVTENVVSDVQITEQDLLKTRVPESEISEPQPITEQSEAPKNDESKIQLENDSTISQLENELSKPKSEEVVQDNSAPESQVSEVSHNLGSPVKYDSISTDSVSINEKIEIKDNIIADNVKLELANNKPEMVPPSSSPKVNSHPHAMDVEEPHESNTPIDDKDDVKKFDSIDMGDSEKLNLDRSSGDDSMEEDMPESKQVESKYRSDDLGDEGGKIEVSDGKDDAGMVDIAGDEMFAEKNGDGDEKDHQYTVAEKRKLNDQPLAGNNEPAKRQRRWNSETLKVPEPQSAKLTVSTTPKESTNRLSKVDSNTEDHALKERVVPPSPKSPTNSLKIDRFLRPFTLKAVQELLGKTGKVTSFWMDHIKTHCYVTYSSVEEAMETRNAVYNLQWPPNGGRLLLAEFVDPQEVKTRLEAPPPPVVSPAAATPPPPAPSPRLQAQKQTPAAPSLPPPPPLSNPPQARERVNLPPPPPLPENLEPPIVTLDDLFRKTRATPRIYYLPLSDEQVAGKAGRGTKL